MISLHSLKWAERVEFSDPGRPAGARARTAQVIDCQQVKKLTLVALWFNFQQVLWGPIDIRTLLSYISFYEGKGVHTSPQEKRCRDDRRPGKRRPFPG